jgi:hypothetical protein
MKRTLSDLGREAFRETAVVSPSRTEPFAENRYRKLRFQQDSILLNAPEASGVYGLFSALWIFIGEADNIRVRLLELLAGDNPCIQDYQPSGFAFELVSPPERSRRLEELVTELQPSGMRKPIHARPRRDGTSHDS